MAPPPLAWDHRFIGSSRSDFIFGTAERDGIFGNTGTDFLFGNAGDDYISGGDGIDFLFGGFGRDDMHGDAGNDYLFGGADSDSLSGGAGNDYLDAGPGNDSVWLSLGRDTAKLGSGRDSVVLFGPGSGQIFDFGPQDRVVLFGVTEQQVQIRGDALFADMNRDGVFESRVDGVGHELGTIAGALTDGQLIINPYPPPVV